ncbi:putative SGNH hydrolase superfamily [Helianthus anomalus]
MYVFRGFLWYFFIYRSPHGEKAMNLPERTNEVTGIYANGCVEVAKEFGVSLVNLWSKMQETQGWQKKFLRLVILQSLLLIWNLEFTCYVARRYKNQKY